MKPPKSANFPRLTQPQEDQARAIGARMAQQCLLDGTLPVWPGCIDGVDVLALFPTGAKPPAIEAATEAAGAGFFTCLDENIPLQPETVLFIEDDSIDTCEIDFSTFKSVSPAMRRNLDPLIRVLLDDAKLRNAWNAGKYLAAYAAIAGRSETLRLFQPVGFFLR